MSPATASVADLSPVLWLDYGGFARIFAGAGDPDVIGRLRSLFYDLAGVPGPAQLPQVSCAIALLRIPQQRSQLTITHSSL
jgi:hypothetical protein